MRIREELKLRRVGSSYFIVDPGDASIDLSNIISLSKAAAYLWEQFQGRDFTPSLMADSLCEKYDVSRETALHDINQMLDQWKEFNLLA